MTKYTTETRLEQRIKKAREKRSAPDELQADLFGQAHESVEAHEPVEERIGQLRCWHRDLSDKITVYAREHTQLAAAGSTEQAELVFVLRETLLAKRASIEADIEALLCNVPRTVTADESGLLRLRHPNRDFFLADMFDYALKDDGASMEAPIFTLSTRPDLSVWQWTSRDGSKSVKVTPSVLGRATQHDKDVLIYVVSQLTEALNRGREDAKNRVIRFTVYDFLVTTNRGVGGDDYRRLQESFERLAGTRITTDIRTGGLRVKEGFGIIDRWKIVERASDERMIAVEITLSEWLYNAVQAFDVLTIHPDYFRLRKPIARRIYELARKHCGRQAQWTIGLPLLLDKSGSRGSIYEFHEAIKGLAKTNILPEYRITVSAERSVADVKVTFYTRDPTRLINVFIDRTARSKK